MLNLTETDGVGEEQARRPRDLPSLWANTNEEGQNPRERARPGSDPLPFPGSAGTRDGLLLPVEPGALLLLE